MNSFLSVVIPVYNAEATIKDLCLELGVHLGSQPYEIILVNDFSKDKTDLICQSLVEESHGVITYLKLAKNFGEHNAVIAGLNYCKGDYAIIIDDDFQNPPGEVPRVFRFMLENDFDVLYTYYEEKQHHFLRNVGSKFNDWVATFLLKKPKDLYLSSFKCINRWLINEVIKYQGPHTYIDGLILRVTGNWGKILVNHEKRKVGRSNYSLIKLVNLWANMFINFSLVPLRASLFTGIFLVFIGFSLVFFFLTFMLMNPQGEWPAGWASLFVTITTFSGVQLMTLGLMGEYLGRLFLQENMTPQFTLRKIIFGQSETPVQTTSKSLKKEKGNRSKNLSKKSKNHG